MHTRGFFTLIWGLVRRLIRWLEAPQRRSLSQQLVPQLFVRRLEDRCVLSGQAGPLAAATQILVVAAGNNHSTAPRDTVLLTRKATRSKSSSTVWKPPPPTITT